MSSSMKNKEPQEEHEATVKLQYPTVPTILPRPPVMEELALVQGLGYEATNYLCLDNGSFALLQAYVDEDKDESFYTLSWARDHVDKSPLMVVGGSNGIIRIINCATEKLSKDESVRLWNIHTGICILVFSGDGGHRKDVLSVVSGV
ncbi:hypothetical protein HU200_056279 [Digitaria exilis]|uniref:Uncharacterized protein n=1 Tax=Digitaria exilis TaxID=1010633 RepID=A0A835AS74_9POAL|nr:hypothetical protein HU200_056279 [Digitaria exilis]